MGVMERGLGEHEAYQGGAGCLVRYPVQKRKCWSTSATPSTQPESAGALPLPKQAPPYFSRFGRMPLLPRADCGPPSVDWMGILGAHFSHSFCASWARSNCAFGGAAGAIGASSGVAKPTPPESSDSSELSFTSAPEQAQLEIEASGVPETGVGANQVAVLLVDMNADQQPLWHRRRGGTPRPAPP